MYDQIGIHFEKKIELKGLEAPDELQMDTGSHNTANTNADRHKLTCHTVRNMDIRKINVAC